MSITNQCCMKCHLRFVAASPDNLSSSWHHASLIPLQVPALTLLHDVESQLDSLCTCPLLGKCFTYNCKSDCLQGSRILHSCNTIHRRSIVQMLYFCHKYDLIACARQFTVPYFQAEAVTQVMQRISKCRGLPSCCCCNFSTCLHSTAASVAAECSVVNNTAASKCCKVPAGLQCCTVTP